LPSRLAEAHAAAMGLVSVDPPYPARSFDVAMLWRKEHDAPALAWLRRLIGESAKSLDFPPLGRESASRAR
jgi:DNA-binding transcriptional LysR family regulator